ncbi:MAG TPA: hypothetical protein VHW43_06200 [Puia sp.]|nr:hypothetical protein [Puia sp.]
MRILLLLLLAPIGAFAQSAPYYLADGLNDFSDQQFRGTNPVYVTLVGTDSMIISTSAGAYEHTSAYKRSHGESYLRRTATWANAMPNFAFIDDNAVILVEEGGSYLLFLKDKNTADGLLGAADKSSVLHLKDSLRSIVMAANNRQRAEKDRTTVARNRKILAAYMRGLQSKRSDPTLIRNIKIWSNNETTTVYIVDANYYITRNYRGEMLNENIPAIIKYHLNGKCYIQWRAFGYEALGGGAFGKDLNTYNKNDAYILATGAGGSLRMDPGVAYEIDCD